MVYWHVNEHFTSFYRIYNYIFCQDKHLYGVIKAKVLNLQYWIFENLKIPKPDMSKPDMSKPDMSKPDM